MIYKVNKEKKKAVVAEMKRRRKDKVAVPYAVFNIGIVICILIFLAFSVFGVVMSISCWKDGYTAEAWAFLIFVMFGVMAAALIYIIPVSVRSVAIRKYLMPWVPKTEEEVVLTEKAVEYGFCNKMWGEYFYTFKIRYHEMVRMEYDEGQCLLRLYGPKEERWWTDSDKSMCHDKFARDVNGKDSTWMEIPTYFEGFEELKRELEKRTGKAIENKSRPFEVYR